MITLDRLVNVLGAYGVRLCGRPERRSARLRSVAMPDATDGRVTGDVLVAVGAGSVTEAVRWAVAAQATVVLVRAGAETAREATVAGESHDVAVMLVDPAVSWSHLVGVVYGLVLEGRETESGRGPTDLFALADNLADAVGGAVTIEDPLSRVLAYSRSQQAGDPARLETILVRQVPERLRETFRARGVFARLAATDEPVFVEPDPSHGMTGRMAVAVRAGRELLGSVWVTCGNPLTGTRHTALANGARAVALHLLRSRASADLERQVESDLVVRLLEGTADAATVVSRLGLAEARMRVVAVRTHTSEEPHAMLLLAFERATTGFGWSRPGRSTLLGDTLYTILPDAGAAAAREWVAALGAGLPPRVRVAAGIGAAAQAAELPASRREAEECLALHETSNAVPVHETSHAVPAGGPPAYDESWDDILLHRLRAAARAGRVPARGPVSALRRHDGQHDTHYVATLRAWLEAQGDLAVAAERLGVHANTVRNRLRRMSEVTPLDLDDPRKRLAMLITLAAEDE
ncbi:PucR family transcriptional regulator [Microbispora bryophytorum]|uniref:DNA-binding protein n=1 Tax=Microbispora bryophytorum TaxID=1460882 RepID=A0A8H9H1G0_9ACTN|nr:helix-turn-helix domain-containing protein [Microbispora bryophytorum]MBD3136796.1 helix-turn-helix domain-containing protein [Microbispora bryophytorum]TQS06371.1 PucR family transcriptional regulator [Microbispora bryophytorum]GGO17149.1 DNA-binding protein [Microbispora bryophytorum]